jgi:hypothetical protein
MILLFEKIKVATCSHVRKRAVRAETGCVAVTAEEVEGGDGWNGYRGPWRSGAACKYEDDD